MKKLISLAVAINILLFTACAQDAQKEKIDKIKDKVIRYFNAQQSDSLYSLAGINLKKSMSAEMFKTVCDKQLFPLGNFNTAEFEKIDKGVAKYKATFDVAILSMYISLDSDDMVEVFLFQPYKKPVTGPIVKTIADNKLTTDLDKKVEDIVQPFMFENKAVAVSIGILKDGIQYFYNYGETVKGNKQLPSNKNLYEIGSITKTFTGILLAKAVTEAKMKLSDPINKYLPKNIPVIKFGDDTVKIVHLSNHTSGLPPLPDNFGATDLVNPYKDYDETKLLTYLKKATVQRKPGTEFEYCNLGVGLLGYILEKVNKMPFEKMVTNFITSKAGMTDTRQFLIKKDSALFMQGYTDGTVLQGGWDFKVLAAAGSLRSNTKDMLQYVAFNLSAKDTKLKQAIDLSQIETYSSGKQKIGLNWFIQNWGWGDLLFHGGATAGYRSLLVINPATKAAVVLLCNTGSADVDSPGIALLKTIDK